MCPRVMAILNTRSEEGVVTITRASMFASGRIRRPHQYTSDCEADILLGHASALFEILRELAMPLAGR